jgi:hypothetical protein
MPEGESGLNRSNLLIDTDQLSKTCKGIYSRMLLELKIGMKGVLL